MKNLRVNGMVRDEKHGISGERIMTFPWKIMPDCKLILLNNYFNCTSETIFLEITIFYGR